MIKTSNPSQLDYNNYQKSGDKHGNSDINNNNNDEYMEIESQSNLKLFRKRSSASSARKSNMIVRNENRLTTKLDDDYIFKLAQNYKLMNKLLKEQNIYSDPKDNYKRRTISITRKPGANYGFDLQTYALLNKSTNHIECIFYVNRVETDSPAHVSGLRVGDVPLAVDGIRIDEFKGLKAIFNYAKEKNTIRLVIISENISKRIDYQSRVNELETKIEEKLTEYKKLCQLEDEVLRKVLPNKSLCDGEAKNNTKDSLNEKNKEPDESSKCEDEANVTKKSASVLSSRFSSQNLNLLGLDNDEPSIMSFKSDDVYVSCVGAKGDYKQTFLVENNSKDNLKRIISNLSSSGYAQPKPSMLNKSHSSSSTSSAYSSAMRTSTYNNDKSPQRSTDLNNNSGVQQVKYRNSFNSMESSTSSMISSNSKSFLYNEVETYDDTDWIVTRL